MAKVKVRGTVSRVSAWKQDDPDKAGFSFDLKDEAEYGKSWRVTGKGKPPAANGDTLTVMGEPQVKMEIWGATSSDRVASAPADTIAEEDIPF